MIPEFNQFGNLPEGIHQATEVEVLNRFATGTARRKWLGERLRNLLETAKATGYLNRVFIWGSFVTNKEAPNDLDILLIMDSEFELGKVSAEQRMLFDHTQAKLGFTADVFWAKTAMDKAMLDLWLDTYQTGRDFKRRGIVEVKLK